MNKYKFLSLKKRGRKDPMMSLQIAFPSSCCEGDLKRWTKIRNNLLGSCKSDFGHLLSVLKW